MRESTARKPSVGWELAEFLRTSRRLLSARGEANSAAHAAAALQQYQRLSESAQLRFFEHLDQDFGLDPAQVLEAAQRYAATPTVQTLKALTSASEPPRQELLRRLNRAPGGTGMIVQMRRQLLRALPTHPQLAAVEADFFHLLSSWFNPGFLQMQQVDWSSPAQLLEKIIQHEAVHAIDGWEDLRRRLQPDRRCFAFFHPQLPGEPLIFVEIALVAEMPAAIAPLIEKSAQPIRPRWYKVAVFYSISNCQPGLRGVSLGNFLIKRVAERLQAEVPSIRAFCTLSPIPGFVRWLDELNGSAAELKPVRTKLQAALDRVNQIDRQADPLALSSADRDALLRLAAIYLLLVSPTARGDPVAKFHLGNGARLQRINWAGDLSKNGVRQSFGMMVNYLYDLDKVEEYHQEFLEGDVVHAAAVARLV
ncbi:MAG TPA: malonyl-CoA decarboxylase [Burkholderiaceae bacterium]|nr:malonyl-CoA decarboxylase [Burkholderiaceae bacterium]